MSCDREFIDYDSHMASSLGYPLPQDSLEMYHHQQNVPPQYMHHHRAPMQQHQIPVQQHQIPTQHHQVPTQHQQITIQRHQIPIQGHQITIQRHSIPIQRHQVSIQRHQVPTVVKSQIYQVPTQQHQIPGQQIRYPNPNQPGANNAQTEPPPLNYLNRMSGMSINVNQNRPYMHPQYRAQQMHLQQQEHHRRHQQMLQQNMMNMQSHMGPRPQLRMSTPPMVVSPSGRQVPIQQQHRPTQQATQWRFHNVRSLAPIWNNFSESTPPPLMPLECHLTESATPTPNSINEEGVDDFNDFDVTDLLRLTLGDENEFNEHNSRKRKGSRSSGEYSPTKKHRRTKADIIADRNEMLLDQCREFYIPLHNNNYPDHVRIFGKNILRENLPNVPNMKLVPKNIDFYRIRNLGYLVTKKGICFSCLTDECKFKSYELDRFKEHLNTYHHIEGCGSREGYCKLCEKHCCGFSLTDEVEHILSTHVKSVDKHPMHQILKSQIRKQSSFQKPLEDFQEDTSNILHNMEDDLIRRCEANKNMNLNDTTTSIESDSIGPKVKKKGTRSNLLNYSIDEDYNPDLENDEVDEEIESEFEETLDDLENDSEPDINEFIQLSDEDDEEEEGDIIFADTESESEESKTDKENSEVPTTESSTKNEMSAKNEEPVVPPEPPELDDIPLYMLNRIKMHQSIKGLNDESVDSKLDDSIVEAFEELMKAENQEISLKQKKRKRKKTYFARKRTSTPFAPRLNKVYNVKSVKELPSCRVMLKRIENARESENTSIEDTEIKEHEGFAVPINLPTPPSSENSRDSLPSPPLNKRPSNAQIQKDIDNDSGLSDHSISNKSVINEDSNEKVMNEQIGQLTDSNKNNPDDESEVQDGNLRFTRNKFRQKREFILNVSTEKMKTRHSINLQKEAVNSVGMSVDDKENSGNKSTNIENLKVLESPKNTQSPSKRPRAVKKQRFIKKFHKIDSFFQKTEPEDTEENNENEVIEIHESPDILPLDNSTENLCNKTLTDLSIEATDTVKKSTEIKKTSLSFVIDDVMSISQQEDENELITLEQLYPWIDTGITKLVQKSRKAVDTFQEEQTKFSTFKCMKQKCSFFTTDFEKYKTHTESYDDGHNFCSFCLYNSSTSQELFEHIESNHMYDRYQCNMCMYRASEKAYVEWHQKRFHTCSSCKILKSPTQILMKSMRIKVQEGLESVNRRKFVHPYVCKTPGCDKQFYNKNNYKNHLKQESDNQSLSQHIDEICYQLLLLDQTRNTTNKEGNNQCLHCEYGSDNNNEINKHMTDNHPSQLGFICRRIAKAETKDNDEETIENQTRVEYIGISSFKVKIYKENVENLTAADVVCPGDGEKVQNKLNDSVEIINDTIVEINNDKQESPNTSAFPIISEIIHIDNF
ncbi:hypothetical protein ACKWTF_009256 [Chironomus riparius]